MGGDGYVGDGEFEGVKAAGPCIEADGIVHHRGEGGAAGGADGEVGEQVGGEGLRDALTDEGSALHVGIFQTDDDVLLAGRGVGYTYPHTVAVVTDSSRAVEGAGVLKGDVVDETVVDVAEHMFAFHLDFQSVGLTGHDVAGSGGQGGLHAVDTLLDGMLRVVPSADVPPAVVLVVDVTEGDEETFGTAAFGGVEREDALVARTFVADVEVAQIACVGLTEYTVGHLPRAAIGVPFVAHFREFVAIDRGAVEGGQGDIVEVGCRGPGSHAEVVVTNGCAAVHGLQGDGCRGVVGDGLLEEGVLEQLGIVAAVGGIDMLLEIGGIVGVVGRLCGESGVEVEHDLSGDVFECRRQQGSNEEQLFFHDSRCVIDFVAKLMKKRNMSSFKVFQKTLKKVRWLIFAKI